jgi:hypothetical protein
MFEEAAWSFTGSSGGTGMWADVLCRFPQDFLKLILVLLILVFTGMKLV